MNIHPFIELIKNNKLDEVMPLIEKAKQNKLKFKMPDEQPYVMDNQADSYAEASMREALNDMTTSYDRTREEVIAATGKLVMWINMHRAIG